MTTYTDVCSNCYESFECDFAPPLKDEKPICYDCAEKITLMELRQRGKGYLYLTKKDERWFVSTWAGGKRFPARIIKKGVRGNTPYWVINFFFAGADWSGVLYNPDWSECVFVRRIK